MMSRIGQSLVAGAPGHAWWGPPPRVDSARSDSQAGQERRDPQPPSGAGKGAVANKTIFLSMPLVAEVTAQRAGSRDTRRGGVLVETFGDYNKPQGGARFFFLVAASLAPSAITSTACAGQLSTSRRMENLWVSWDV